MKTKASMDSAQQISAPYSLCDGRQPVPANGHVRMLPDRTHGSHPPSLGPIVSTPDVVRTAEDPGKRFIPAVDFDVGVRSCHIHSGGD